MVSHLSGVFERRNTAHNAFIRRSEYRIRWWFASDWRTTCIERVQPLAVCHCGCTGTSTSGEYRDQSSLTDYWARQDHHQRSCTFTSTRRRWRGSRSFLGSTVKDEFQIRSYYLGVYHLWDAHITKSISNAPQEASDPIPVEPDTESEPFRFVPLASSIVYSLIVHMQGRTWECITDISHCAFPLGCFFRVFCTGKHKRVHYPNCCQQI